MTGEFLKWLSKSSKDYLKEMKMDLEKPLECGRTLLHYAASIENTSYLKALIPKFESVDVLDKENKTPLHIACEVGNYEAVKLLLKSKANANLTNSKGLTSLMITAKKKIQDTKMTKILLKYHASCDIETKDGMRAIDYARQVKKTSPIIDILQNKT